jgi:hypothetical protein
MIQNRLSDKNLHYKFKLQNNFHEAFNMIFSDIKLLKRSSLVLIAIAATGICMFNSCSDDDPTGPQNPQIVDIAISPSDATFASGEQLNFSVVALTATGDTVDTADLDIEWQWWSTDTEVFTVEPGGLATGQNPGEAYCIVEANINVSQHAADMPDKLIVKTGILTHSQSQNLSLTAGNKDVIAELETVSMKSMLRFTGRDSAFVVVF